VITRHYNDQDVENAAKMIVDALAGIDTAHGKHAHKHDHEHAS
jgi:hypothetical protein